MTSISQPVLPPQQAPSTVSQTVKQAHQPLASGSGKTTPQLAGTAPVAARSYASVSRKQLSPTATTNSSSSSGGVGGFVVPQHGKSDSVNGRGTIPPAVPAVGTPNIANGTAGISPISGPGDHNRKTSVTISAAGTSGFITNGGPVTGKPIGANPIQFGSVPNQNTSSLAVHNVPNPRITSPSTSPSPIPQPAASGGRPPSSLHSQGNGLNFRSIEGEEANLRSTGVPPGPLAQGAQSSHIRRESSQSTHSDLGNQVMGHAGGRGYQAQPNRGRGNYNQQYAPPMAYSSGPNYRSSPNPSRGNQGMAPPFQPQARSLAPYPGSPHQPARSPHPIHAQPVPPQPGQIPIPNPQWNPQHFSGYPPAMGVPQVKPQSSSSSSHRNPSVTEQQMAPFPSQSLRSHPPPDLSPHSGFFEHYLTLRNQNQYAMGPGYDPGHAAAFYNQHLPSMYSPMYMPPTSPRPHHQLPQISQSPYIAGQYSSSPQPQQMSRNASAMSASDRPSSSLGKSQTSVVPPPVNHAPVVSRQTNSPAPANTNFQIPARKGAGIVIKHPESHDIITFDKSAAPPSSSSRSSAVVSSTPTPPPRTPSRPDAPNPRNDLKESVLKKMEADIAEEKRIKEEAELKAAEEKKAEETRIAKEKEEAEAKQLEAAKAQMEAEEAAKKAKAEAEEAEKAAAKAKEDADRAQKELDEEAEYARIGAEMERQEKEAEERYQKKKQAEKEEKARKEAEAAARADEDLKRAEREIEEAEDERLKKLEESEGDDSRKERFELFAALKKDGAPSPSSDTPATVETPLESGAATPASENSMPPPLRPASSARQKPAALILEPSKAVEPAQPSAAFLSLRSARRLTSVKNISYPAPFASPNPALNSSAPSGQIRYDRDFLMQFQRAFVEKPQENWDGRIKESVGETTEVSSARTPSTRSHPPLGQRQPSNRGSTGVMGTFGAPGSRPLPPGVTSQPRYQASTTGLMAPPKNPMQNPLASFVTGRQGGFPMGIGKPMERTSSSNSTVNHPSSPRGNPSQRAGGGRGSKSGRPQVDKLSQVMPLTAGKDLKPIERSESGWKPRSVGVSATGTAGPAPGGDTHMPPDVVQGKVKSNLNKMTPSNFDRISGQILAIAGQSKSETDGRTLRQIIQLTFEKATDEANWSQMYAEFCKRMLESVSPEVKDVGILDKSGNVVVGGALFRKYLLTRCQEEFERGWKVDLPPKPEGVTTEAAMLSDDYYIAAAAKRRGLGLVKFIGELYKLGMLTERIMHECVKKLVDYEGIPGEAEVESLTSLLRTIGESLDNSDRGRNLMDAYFKRIKIMIGTKDLQSRLMYMLMDIVELREKHWHTKGGAIKGPTTLDEVRAQAVAAEREKELQRMQDAGSRRGGPGGPGGSGGSGGSGRLPMGRGDARNFSGSQYGMMPPPDYQRNTVGVEDLRRLGSRGSSRQANAQTSNTVLGPTSMFSSRGSNNARNRPLGPSGIVKPGEESGGSSRTGTPPAQKEKKEKEDKEAAKHANAFSALEGLNDASGETADPASPPSATSPLPDSKPKPADIQRSKSPLGKENAEDTYIPKS